jgi:cytochrome c-type biogenesis protein CcmH/NrfG
LINSGNNNQAILALEAHLQKNMQDGESWRILGKILQ